MRGQVTLRLIASRLLPFDEAGGRSASDLYVSGELVQSRTLLLPPSGSPGGDDSYHLYVSPHNKGAAALVREVKEARGLELLRWTDRIESLRHCESMLVYLNGRTFAERAGIGLNAGSLAEDIQSAMRGGVRLILAHEAPGIGQDERHPVEFGTFFDSTPPGLVASGLYGQIAVTLKGSEWRATSMAMVASAIAEGHSESGFEMRKLLTVDKIVGSIRGKWDFVRTRTSRVLQRTSVRHRISESTQDDSGAEADTSGNMPMVDSHAARRSTPQAKSRKARGPPAEVHGLELEATPSSAPEASA